MKTIDRIQEFKTLIFGSKVASHWWEKLKGEVRQGRPDGRYLAKTLDTYLGGLSSPNLVSEYRATKRRNQYFFSLKGEIDGVYAGIGVEEKCVALSRDKVLDGVLSRGLVWTLGNPQGVPSDDLGATGIVVILPGSPLHADLARAFFGAIVLARNADVHPFFVNGETGDYWPREAGESSALPAWLAESSTLPAQAPPPNTDVLDELDRLEAPQPTEPFFGNKQVFSTKVIDGVKVALAEWSNEWQMIDVGLMLRAMGYAAVKVRYCSVKKLTLGVHGVERRVAEEMRARFGVILDWGLDLTDGKRTDAGASA